MRRSRKELTETFKDSDGGGVVVDSSSGAESFFYDCAE